MHTSTATTVSANRILNVLSLFGDREINAHLEPVKFKHGEIVYEPDEPIKYVYFPETCVFSQLTVFSDGSSIESGIVGREGMTGVSVVLSPTNATRETCVQTSGSGYRIDTERFQRALENDEFRALVMQFGSAFYEQVAQSGACSNHHPATQRLARLLLMFHDRVDGNRFFITQESMAQMLGIHRPSATIAALQLKEKGLIDYSRGVIVVKDRAGLKAEACECYELIARIYETYTDMIELRQLDLKMRLVNDRMASEMMKRRELQNLIVQNSRDLRRAVLGAKVARHDYKICRSCHDVHDETGRWLNMIEFLESHLRESFSQCLCPSCRERQ